MPRILVVVVRINRHSCMHLVVYTKNPDMFLIQTSSIMTNSKDDQDQTDKYCYASRENMSKEMLMCNMKALIFII